MGDERQAVRTARRALRVGLHLPETERIAPWAEIGGDVPAGRGGRLRFDLGAGSPALPASPTEEPAGPWECWSILSAVAAVTTRVEIGPLVLCTNFRNPGLIAKMAETVDEISGGRLILGLGAGWHEPEYRAFGFPYEQRVRPLRRGVHDHPHAPPRGRDRLRRQALHAARLRAPAARTAPGGPPLLIGSRGEQILRLTLPHVDAWNGWYAWNGNTVAGLAPLREQVDRICAEVGRDPTGVERTMAVLVRYPDATEPPDPRATPLTGSPEEIAAFLRDLAGAGIAHVQVVLEPNTCETIERFAPVLEALDRSLRMTSGRRLTWRTARIPKTGIGPFRPIDAGPAGDPSPVPTRAAPARHANGGLRTRDGLPAGRQAAALSAGWRGTSPLC